MIQALHTKGILLEIKTQGSPVFKAGHRIISFYWIFFYTESSLHCVLRYVYMLCYWQQLMLTQKLIYVSVNPFLHQVQIEHSELVVLVQPSRRATWYSILFLFSCFYEIGFLLCAYFMRLFKEGMCTSGPLRMVVLETKV